MIFRDISYIYKEHFRVRNCEQWNESQIGIRRIFENNKIKYIEFKFKQVVTEFTVSVKSVKCQILRKIKKMV